MRGGARRPAKWTSRVLKLNENHGWKAKPGHKIFVADRGAVRFDIPEDWIVEPGPDSIKFHDREPPDDDCLLQVSVIHLPPGIDWSELSLPRLLHDATTRDNRQTAQLGETHYLKRDNLELAWYEAWFFDPVGQREAHSRACLARGANVQPFITMDFWPEDAARFDPVWNEVLRSLTLGEYIADHNGQRLH